MSRRKQQEDKERISSLVDSMCESSSRFDRLHDRFNKTNSPEDANEILEDLMFMVQVFDSAKNEIISKLNDIKRPSLSAVRNINEDPAPAAPKDVDKDVVHDRSRFQTVDDILGKQRSRDRDAPIQPPSQYDDKGVRIINNAAINESLASGIDTD
jgi:DNA-directed RNA polymerase subunit F